MSLIECISEQLQSIQLQDDDITEYIAGIIQEDTLTEDEKRETILEFLSETTDSPCEDLLNPVFAKWKDIQAETEKEDEERRAVMLKEAQLREQEKRRELEKKAQKSDETMEKKRETSAEDKALRDQLERQYGYVDDSPDTIPTEMPQPRRKGGKHGSSTMPQDADPVATLLQPNMNTEKIKQQEQDRREQLRKKHEQEKERNKLNLQKQRADKDKDKDRKQTVKKEKRRM